MDDYCTDNWNCLLAKKTSWIKKENRMLFTSGT